jgi:Bacterial RNA polymerase, alpha chain C terminal domain
VRFGWRVKILPGVRVGSRGVRIGPRAVGLRVSRKSASITGGVGPVYYSTYGGRRRRKPVRSSGVGCWAALGILLLIGLGFSLVVVTYGLILIPVVLIGGIVVWVRHRNKQGSMVRKVQLPAREGRPLQAFLSPRLVNLLSRRGITTENQLRQLGDEDLLRLPGFGLKSLAEVREALPQTPLGTPPQWEALNQPSPLPPTTVSGPAVPVMDSGQVLPGGSPDAEPPFYGVRTEDGTLWWDGYNWQPAIEPTPPPLEALNHPPASVKGPSPPDTASEQLVRGEPPVPEAPSDAVLFGVPRSPAEVRELLRRQPHMWEYLLFAGVLAEEKEALEPKWRDHEMRNGQRSGPLLSDNSALQFLQSSLDSAQATMSTVNRVLNPSAQEAAFGPKGVAGDPVHIKELGQRVVSIYESLLDWAASVRMAKTSSNLEHLFELAASSVDTPIVQIRQFIDRVVTEIDRVPSYVANGQRKTIVLELTVKVDNPKFREFANELERLGRRLRR